MLAQLKSTNQSINWQSSQGSRKHWRIHLAVVIILAILAYNLFRLKRLDSPINSDSVWQGTFKTQKSSQSSDLTTREAAVGTVVTRISPEVVVDNVCVGYGPDAVCMLQVT